MKIKRIIKNHYSLNQTKTILGPKKDEKFDHKQIRK